jgi:hypothetical protein
MDVMVQQRGRSGWVGCNERGDGENAVDVRLASASSRRKKEEEMLLFTRDIIALIFADKK